MKKYAFLIVVSALLLGECLLDVLLLWRFTPGSDNLTGLFWLKGEHALVGLWALCAFGALALLSWQSFAIRSRQRILMLWACGMMAAGLFVPYQAQEGGLSGLHLLLCAAGAGLWVLCFGYQYACCFGAQKKTAAHMLFCAAVSLVLFAWTQSISLLCELWFVFTASLVLYCSWLSSSRGA